MTQNGMNPPGAADVEALLREELARGDEALRAASPILRQLLANDDNSLFGDEIVARVRGMIADCASQLLLAEQGGDEGEGGEEMFAIRQDALGAALVENTALLAHCHALALEWRLAERLQRQIALDPVLTPLLQSAIASTDGALASIAMAMLAAQARFMQHGRRMELPLGELPGDLFHLVLLTWRASAEENRDSGAAEAEARLRAGFDESASRLGLASRLVTALGGNAGSALSLGHAGLAIFLTALGLASSQARSAVTMATNERQLARFALSLRAAGLKPAAVAEQFGLFHADFCLPDGFEQIRPDRAAAILAMTPPAAAA